MMSFLLLYLSKPFRMRAPWSAILMLVVVCLWYGYCLLLILSVVLLCRIGIKLADVLLQQTNLYLNFFLLFLTECNCDPAGVPDTFKGCGTLPPGELCKCKDRVHGRICNECRPLFWNLQATNPEGCEGWKYIIIVPSLKYCTIISSMKLVKYRHLNFWLYIQMLNKLIWKWFIFVLVSLHMYWNCFTLGS